ncbi:MAG: hypothetical protein KDC92_15590 [Bacteroidetes bacterium]|nr:hypothetical protein [Bacteroidota bacterium]
MNSTYKRIKLQLQIIRLLFICAIAVGVLGFYEFRPNQSSAETDAENTTLVSPASEPKLAVGSTDPISGFVVDEKGHFELVRTTCGACHSTALVTQNRATRQGWKDLIVWMQETQKLWDLGENEEPILDYLSTHYAPTQKGRRPNLTGIEWYELGE